MNAPERKEVERAEAQLLVLFSNISVLKLRVNAVLFWLLLLDSSKLSPYSAYSRLEH